MKLEQLLRDGAAPNPTNNCTIAEAKGILAFLAPLMNITRIVVNTAPPARDAWPVLVELVPVEGFEIPADALLSFAVEVDDGGRLVYLGVANLQHVRVNQGDRQSAIVALEKVIPDYAGKPELFQKVQQLLPYVPAPVVVDQPVAAMPDWDAPLKAGTLGCRPGDLSKIGEEFVSPAGVKWVKGIADDTMFLNVWRRVN